MGVPPDRLPTVVRAGCDLGPMDGRNSVSPIPKLRFGLPQNCRFVVGCLDQYAGAIGAGNTTPGAISETTGTVLASVRCADRFDSSLRAGLVQGPTFAEGLYYQLVCGDVAANYLDWYRQQLPDHTDFEQLADMAGQVEPGAGGLRLKTGVALTANAKTTRLEDVFEGLTANHTPGHMVRCIMEAVASALHEQITALSRGVPPPEIRSVGGGARSQVWLQIKADVLGIPVATTECPEPTCLGAAILAEASCGGRSVGEMARRWVRPKPPHFPNPQRYQQYWALRTE
jgi:sugar (pentulose or hexulose) kinase